MLQYSNALAYRVEFNISENSPSLLLVNNLTVRVTSRNKEFFYSESKIPTRVMVV